MKLTYPAPIPDPSGHLIQLSHVSLIISEDFEMEQKVKMTFYTNDEGTFGIPVLDSIELNPNTTPEQKARLRLQWAPQYRTATTRGNKINPSTGQLVHPDEDGNYPEGSVDEKAIWINVLASEAPGHKISEKVMALLVGSMGKMVANGRI